MLLSTLPNIERNKEPPAQFWKSQNISLPSNSTTKEKGGRTIALLPFVALICEIYGVIRVQFAYCHK